VGEHAARRGAAASSGPVAAPGELLVVAVLPDVRPLARPFDYRWPDRLGPVEVGSEVRVPLQGRRVRGWVVAVGVTPPAGVVLHEVLAVRSLGPPPAVVELAQWAAWRWAGTPAAFLRTAAAPRVVPTTVRSAPLPAATNGAPDRVPAPPALGRRPAAERAWAELVKGSGGDAEAGTATVLRLGPQADRRGVLLAAAGLASGPRGVLIVVPEQADAARVVELLRAAGVAEVHPMPDHWAAARAGGGVVVGTRRAAWAPLPQLAAAVVLDAHDPALVEQRAPTWSAVDVVVERARRDGADCLLVSPCPPVTLLAGGTRLVADRARERRQWPAVEVVDLRASDPRLGLLTERTTALVRWAADRRSGDGQRCRRVAVVLNRRGGARLVLCASCGDIARCERCVGPLELDERDPSPRLVCRRCGQVRPVVCAACGSTAVRRRRPGVASIGRQLQALVGLPVTEVVADRAMPAAETWGPVVVGTEAVLRANVGFDAVVLADMDTELLAPRLGAAEHALGLVARAARALRRSQLPPGPGRGAGRLVVQTRQPDHVVVRAAVAADPAMVAADELAVRQALGWPPASAVAHVSGPGASAVAAAVSALAAQGASGASAGDDRPVVPSGPLPGGPGVDLPVEVDGPSDGRWTVRAPSVERLCDLLAAVGRPSARVRIDVDPVDL